MDDLLQQGVNSYKSGDHETARRLFISATKQSPDSERAWGWLYNVCKTDQERIHCLKQITRINPENVKAKELLAKLTELEPPLEQPVKQVVQKPVEVPSPTQQPQIINNTPWYRSTLAYVLLFIFITPLWAILILTDKKQRTGVKILALIIGALYLFSCCLSPILLGGGGSYSDAIDNVIIVDSTCHSDSIGNVIFEGTVKNTGTLDLQFVELRATFKDNAGNVINTNTGYIDSDILYANQTSTFTVYVDNPNYANGKCSMRVENARYK